MTRSRRRARCSGSTYAYVFNDLLHLAFVFVDTGRGRCHEISGDEISGDGLTYNVTTITIFFSPVMKYLTMKYLTMVGFITATTIFFNAIRKIRS